MQGMGGWLRPQAPQPAGWEINRNVKKVSLIQEGPQSPERGKELREGKGWREGCGVDRTVGKGLSPGP